MTLENTGTKEKMIYQEGYKKPYPEFSQDKLPNLTHLSEGFQCTEAKLLKAGVIERDGERFEFQDIRVILKETK